MTDKNQIVADAILDLSKSLRLLGNGNILREDTNPGAIEGLAMLIRNSNKEIASSIDGIASAIQELAEAIEKSK